MPKRGGRSRGGSRGGRGGRGGSRGGGTGGGSFRSLNLSKSSKRRARKNKAAAHGHHDDPELMDLGTDGYVPQIGNSMSSLSKRPNRRMMDEARYTDKHLAETMSQPLRYRRIEFVKAQEVYDPGKDLIESLKKYDRGENEANERGAEENEKDEKDEKDDLLSDMKKLNVQQGTTPEPRDIIETGEITKPLVSSEPEVPEIIEATENFTISDVPEVPPVTETVKDIKHDHLEPVSAHMEVEQSSVNIDLDHTAELAEESSHSPVESAEEPQISLPEETNRIDHQGDESVGDISQEDEIDEVISPGDFNVSEQILQNLDDNYDNYNIDNDEPNDVEMYEEFELEQASSGESDVYIEGEEDEDEHEQTERPALDDFFTIDETGDDEVFQKHSVQKQPTATVLKSVYKKKNAPKPQKKPQKVVPSTDHDSYLKVGNVMLKTSKDEFGNLSADFPRAKKMHGSTTLANFPESYDEEESEDSDEEAAFEDYKAQIMRDFEFDDDDDFEAGDSEDDDLSEGFADVDGGVIFDYADVEKGGPAKFEYYDDSDIYISSDEDGSMGGDNIDGDDMDEQFLNSDEEGLEDILAFARSQQKVKKELDIPATQTLKKKGKGKKQKLELGSHLELELRESLMEQFQYQKQSKREKKLRKKEKRQREGIELHDLNIKYDYSLHIQEIKNEFETFLHDAGRESMSFPPLDAHGNKTVNKLAGHYNMKCIRCGGNGLSLFMKVAKTKKTFRYVPAYDQIGYIMKQRPVFKRVDVKPRTKEEIAETDGKKTKGGPKGDAIVREGDIVGGKAPEIGNNNIGRLLLEKLGWVKGEGLGALGNKGISEPLTATVKRSKTGLK